MNEAIFVATHLTTRHESKKHGGYDVYEDDKIIIKLDTYVPNLDVYIKTEAGTKTVHSESYHGTVYEHHPGKWQEYITDVLMPKAYIAKAEKEKERDNRRV